MLAQSGDESESQPAKLGPNAGSTPLGQQPYAVVLHGTVNMQQYRKSSNFTASRIQTSVGQALNIFVAKCCDGIVNI